MFSKDAEEGCNETMTACAERTIIESNLMYNELHPNFDLTERNGVCDLGRRTLGGNGVFTALRY